jgi:hypothetical protein
MPAAAGKTLYQERPLRHPPWDGKTVFRDGEGSGGPLAFTLWMSHLWINEVVPQTSGRDRFQFELGFDFWDPYPTSEHSGTKVVVTGIELASYAGFQGAALGQLGRLVRNRGVEENQNPGLAWTTLLEDAFDEAGVCLPLGPVPRLIHVCGCPVRPIEKGPAA